MKFREFLEDFKKEVQGWDNFGFLVNKYFTLKGDEQLYEVCLSCDGIYVYTDYCVDSIEGNVYYINSNQAQSPYEVSLEGLFEENIVPVNVIYF